ncbi:MAG: hypothetical protein A2252_03005 [Elusimicrobia bacterium RIFOXYA2_FULL_39_19]|nr:MAG: hypothetical protein A2252_03005 [Elusimicrobia bacterium RIFOXYA2_FULL_39_19]
MLLINPKVQKLGKFFRYVPMSPPIGLGNLAGYLQSKNKNVVLVDENITPITSESVTQLAEKLTKPYIFGITSVTGGIKRAHEISDILKTKYPDSKVILGGIHPTVLPDETLQNPNVDIVVKGEGEETLLSLYETIKNNTDYTKLDGISYKDSSGTIVHNPAAKLPDINTIPKFPYHLFEEHKERYNLGFIASSRGCPFNCIFCSQRSISGRKYRFMPPEKVIEMMDLLINKYGHKFITFVDDDFIVNKERTKILCRLIQENKFHEKACFDFQTRSDTVTEEILILMKSSGFRAIDYGIETASERVMKIINKGETVEEIIKAVKMTKSLGFHVSGTFIIGLPTETKKERWQSYKLAKELDLDYVRFNNATPYPGTELYEMAKKENRLNIVGKWENLNACATLVENPFVRTSLAYVPLTTTEKELRADILKMNLFFSLRPKRVIQLVLRRVGPVGWFSLPKRWYLNPKEIYHFTVFVLTVFLSFVKIFIDFSTDKEDIKSNEEK